MRSRRVRRWASAAAVAVLLVGCGGGGGDDDSALNDDEDAAEETTTTDEPTTTTEAPTTTTTTVAIEPEDTVGTDIAIAIGDLLDAGYDRGDLEEVEVIDESVPDGQVTDAVEQPDGSVVLTVARRAQTRFLEELRPVSGSVGGPSFNVSGTTYTHGISAGGCPDEGSFFEYDLGRDYRQLLATVGLLDTEPSDRRVRLEISVDGEIQGTPHDLGIGDTIAVDLDVTDALRFGVRITSLIRGDCIDVGFGDARLLGVPSEVPDIPAG